MANSFAPSVNQRPPYISETIRARQLKFHKRLFRKRPNKDTEGIEDSHIP